MERIVQIGLVPITPDVLLNLTKFEVKVGGVTTEFTRNSSATTTEALFASWMVQANANKEGINVKSGPGLLSFSLSGPATDAGVVLHFSNKDAETISLAEHSLGTLLIEQDLQNIERKVIRVGLSHLLPANADVVRSAIPALLG
jgi:16S rRNA G966 N2-methylase RsmD